MKWTLTDWLRFILAIAALWESMQPHNPGPSNNGTSPNHDLTTT